MNVAIVGSREYPRMDAVRRYVRSLDEHDIVISGGARGVDTVAERAARHLGIRVAVYPADWAIHGLRAGAVRNKVIVEQAGRVVAFWDGESPGTKITIDLARKKGIPVIVYGPDGEPYE